MSDSITIARPYAKAIFEYALAREALQGWSNYLQRLAFTVLEERAANFITNPATSPSQHSELLFGSMGKVNNNDTNYVKNFIETLAHNKRLLVLPDIMTLFNAMRATQEKTLSVDVLSFSALSNEQQQELIASLSKRLKRQVTLNITINKDLIGGAVIHAGDLVIDGSVRGKLDKLRTGLAA